MQDQVTPTINILRLPVVIRRTGLSKTVIYERIKVGTFPKAINLGGRAVGWIETEIDGWLTGCVQASRQGGAS